MPPLQIMIKPVSGACNLACKYCFYEDEAKSRSTACFGRMEKSTAVTLIRKAFIYAEDSVSFTFQGGEPLLWGVDNFKFFIKTVGEYNARGLDVSYSLQTNGTLLTDEFCRLFSEHEFLLEVSLDGTEDTHDLLRTDKNGDGSYSAVIRGIKKLKKHDVSFNILCVLTKYTAERIDEVWRALSPYGFIQFIPCLDPLSGEVREYSLDADSYGRALVDIFDRYASSPLTRSERRMDNYISILLGYPAELCGMCGKCPASFVCEADGSVYPCDFYVLDKYKLGNIHETSFLRMAGSDVMRDFLAEGARIPDGCSKCEYLWLCRGGCRRDRENTETSRFCESYKYFFDRRLDRMQALAEQIDDVL